MAAKKKTAKAAASSTKTPAKIKGPVAKPAATKPAKKIAPKAAAKSPARPVTKAASAVTPKKSVKTAIPKKAKPVASSVKARKAAGASASKDRSDVLLELKSLSKELNKAASVLNIKKNHSSNPREVSTILGNVERMTSEAATKSLAEAESAKQVVFRLKDTLGREWSRSSIEVALREIGDHLTNIIVAQEFQDLAGQSLRQSIKALVGAIIVIEGGGPTAEGRLSQNEVDSLLNDLM